MIQELARYWAADYDWRRGGLDRGDFPRAWQKRQRNQPPEQRQ
jgi:hypothetical protein